MEMDVKALMPAEKQYFLQHIIVPRPVCFASTIDAYGNVNLSPFSFFNMFSTDPPVVIFSPSRRLRDGSTKHTLQNVLEIPEVAINIVTYDMVQQMSLASCEYPRETSEFLKSGFTPEKAVCISPPLVKESKVKLECLVIEVKCLGQNPGAGNLVICEVIYMHIDDSLVNEDQKFDQAKLEVIARLGEDWYCRVNSSNLFKVPKPNVKLGIGWDAIPVGVRNSKVLTANHIGQLANVDQLPFIQSSFDDDHVKKIIEYFSINPAEMEAELHRYASELLNKGKVKEAWQVLLTCENL